MEFLDLLILRGFLLVFLPLLVVTLAIGPRKLASLLGRGWNWLRRRRLDPEVILTHVVEQHVKQVAKLKELIAQAERAEADIQRNLRESTANAASCEAEAHRLATAGDDLGTRGALYKLNLERAAATYFGEHLLRQQQLITEARQRLYLLELQLRQYEVGRTILVSQLAQAETVEQQFAIASQFDPFNAVADWQRAEGIVQEKALTARAIERVYADTADVALPGPTPRVDPGMLDAQLAALRAQIARTASAAVHDIAGHDTAEPQHGAETNQSQLKKNSNGQSN